ncbi:MAG TPA: hypothetical protein VGD29_07040 [Actinoplanes sp.]
MDQEQTHHGRHRKHDDDDVKARQIEESVEADLPPTELSVEEEAARAAEENR